jgi:L-threonylcarbamoyladenylate synthase
MADLRGRIDLIVDGGATPVGVESTIVACLGELTLLRPGGLAREVIEALLGRPLAEAQGTEGSEEGEALLAPGMLASHYAPRAPLRLDAQSVEPGEALLAFGLARLPGIERAHLVLNLSPRGDLVEAAANLFSHLRALDAAGATAIAVMPIPTEGLGDAINDRLRRAAAPRPAR